jgi:hypothetical protein
MNAADVESKTDLAESCGALALPCIAKIGTCVHKFLTHTEDGHLAGNHRACNCFARGAAEPLKIASQPNLMITCPFECAEAMRSAVDQHMTAINGVGGEKLQCKDTFADISETQYGGRNDEVSSGVETDDFEMEPLDDPSVQRAAASMLANINGYRHKNCPHMPLFPAPAHVLYAKAGLGDEGLRQYRLEVQLGGGQVYEGRMAHLPLEEEFESLDQSSPSAYGSYQVMRVVVAQVCAR